MGTLLRVLLVAAHVAATVFSCAVPDVTAPAPEPAAEAGARLAPALLPDAVPRLA